MPFSRWWSTSKSVYVFERFHEFPCASDTLMLYLEDRTTQPSIAPLPTCRTDAAKDTCTFEAARTPPPLGTAWPTIKHQQQISTYVAPAPVTVALYDGIETLSLGMWKTAGEVSPSGRSW